MKRIIGSIAAFAVISGALTIAAPAANANDSSDFEFEVISTSKGDASVNTKLSSTQLTKINGADQVLWQESDYKPNLSSVSVKNAYKKKIKVIATGANSSKVINTKSKHSKLVVLKPSSKFRNTGKHNQRRVGFPQTVTKPTVVKYDKRSKQYRHAADLLTKAQVKVLQRSAKAKEYQVVGSIKIGSKRLYIVTWCGNYIGGKVPMLNKVVQVRFLEDLLMESVAESVAQAKVEIDFKVTCPDNGASFVASGFAWAYGRASDKLVYSQRTRATEISGLEYRAKQNLTIDQNVQAEAQASIKVSGHCGDSTPSTPAPGAVINEVNDVVAYNSRPVSFALSGVAGETLQVTAYAKHGGSITAGKSQSLVLDNKGDATGTLTFTAGEVPLAPLTYTVNDKEYTIDKGKDVIWLQVRDSHSNTVWVKSNDFDIRAVPGQSE